MIENAPFLDSRLFMKWTKEFGHGVFTRENIPNNTFVEIAPVVVFDPKEVIDGSEVMNYVVSWETNLAIPLGWTMVYNHSDESNCVFSMNSCEKLMAIVTIKEIKANEQLTVNYGPDWFSSRGMEKIRL